MQITVPAVMVRLGVQGIAKLSSSGIVTLAQAIFEVGPPVVFQAYSPFSKPLRRFNNREELIADLQIEMTSQKSFQYALHYPDRIMEGQNHDAQCTSFSAR